ncbi:MAG: hypothetical protein IPJ65_41140 [Archangiaceae bacterium]|nr:hypothetical protein [Archangiaceae bacterium]
MRSVSICLLFFASTAVAQTRLFGDDFETGTLTPDQSPPGVWAVHDGVANTSTNTSAEAAHRGAFGLRMLDNEGVTTYGNVTSARVRVNVDAGSLLAIRFWIRVTPTTAAGNLVFVGMLRQDPKLFYPGARVDVGAHLPDGGYSQVSTTADLSGGQWHLFEYTVSDVGASSTSNRRMFIDGTSVLNDRFDTSGASGLTSLGLGQGWADDRSFKGSIDFDDFRVTNGAPASTLAFADAGSTWMGGCAPLSLTLSSSAGTSAAAPYDVRASLSVTGVAASWYSDAQCTTRASEVVIPAGATHARAWLQSTGVGTAVVRASHDDFLTRVASLGVSQSGPIARLEPAMQKVVSGARVSFDGSASVGAGGGYHWFQPEGPTGVRLDPGGATQALTLTEPGTYVFELSVSDELGRTSAPARATVVVDPTSGCSSAPALFAALALWLTRSRRPARASSRAAAGTRG